MALCFLRLRSKPREFHEQQCYLWQSRHISYKARWPEIALLYCRGNDRKHAAAKAKILLLCQSLAIISSSLDGFLPPHGYLLTLLKSVARRNSTWVSGGVEGSLLGALSRLRFCYLPFTLTATLFIIWLATTNPKSHSKVKWLLFLVHNGSLDWHFYIFNKTRQFLLMHCSCF